MSTDFYYYHNIKATIVFESKNKAEIDWLDKGDGEFSFIRNYKRHRSWKGIGYFPVEVRRHGKYWGEFDYQRLNLNKIVTRGDFEHQAERFISLLKKHDPDISIKETKINYVEICTRYQDKHFDDVANNIKKAEARFFTTDKVFGFDKRVRGKDYITLAASLFIDKNVLNIKTYRFVENFSERKKKISDTRLPKIEVQIYSPKNLIEAKNEAIPLIKAFQKHIGFETSPMTEPEYCLIQDTQSLHHNTRLFNCLQEEHALRAIKFPKDITQDDLTHTIACFIATEAKSTNEILGHANISRSTLQRKLKILEPYLEKRGHKGIGIYYQIDINLLEQQTDNNKPKQRLFTNDRGNNHPKSTGSTKKQDQLSVTAEAGDSTLRLTHNEFAYRLIYLHFFIFIRSHIARATKSVSRLAIKSAKSQFLPVFTSPHTFANRQLCVSRDISRAV